MQNKPKLRKSQISLTPVKVKVYEKKTLSEPGKNKPKTNPNKAKQIEDPEATQIKANPNPCCIAPKPPGPWHVVFWK